MPDVGDYLLTLAPSLVVWLIVVGAIWRNKRKAKRKAHEVRQWEEGSNG